MITPTLFSGVQRTGVLLLDTYEKSHKSYIMVLNSYSRSRHNEVRFERFMRAGGSDFDSLLTQKLLLAAFVFGVVTKHETPR